MCGRYYIPDGNDYEDFRVLLSRIRERYDKTPELALMKLGEVFPSDVVPVVTQQTPALMRWGFASPGLSRMIINARLESADEKPMFRGLFRSRRCLVPASHYFEWKKDKAEKRKYAIGLRRPIYMAGLYRVEEGLPVPLFVILTRPAAADIEFIHERMPVLVPEQERENWLYGRTDARELLEPPKESFIYRSI